MAEITIKCVEGNPLAINVVMTAIEHSMLNGEMVTETVDFYPDTTKPVRAVLDCTTARRQYCPQTSVTDNVVYVSDNGSIAAGVYTLTITCTDTQGKKRRYKSDPCIEVYDATSAAEIAATFDSQTYELNGVFYTFAGGGGTVQADWDETDPNAPSYIQNKPDLSEYATDEELQAVEESIPDVPAWALQPQKPTYTATEVGALSSDTPLFSGDYNDLDNKPTIPSAVTESTVSGWGFTKNAGTITGITMNGTSKGTSGVVNLGTVLTEHQDISGKANSADVYTKPEVDDMIEDVAYFGDTVGNVVTADFNAQSDTVWNKTQVLSAAQQAQARTNISAQEALVSGTNIKTINNESILGSGNITISGGSGDVNVIESITFNGSAVPVDSSKNAAITYSAPVTSVNGQTGAVSLTIPTVPSNIVTGTSSSYTIWVGTQAQYEAITTKDATTIYLITGS